MHTRRPTWCRLIGSIAGLVTLIAAGSLGGGYSLAQTRGPITLTVDCYSTPERTTITNNTNIVLNLSNFTLGSIFQPRVNEPFTLSGVLPIGESQTYETGPGATTNPLSKDEIYDDTAPTEGVRLTLAGASFEVLCTARTGSQETFRYVSTLPASRVLTPTTSMPPTSVTVVTGATAAPTWTSTAAPSEAQRDRQNTGVGRSTGQVRLLPLTLSLGILLMLGGILIIHRRT